MSVKRSTVALLGFALLATSACGADADAGGGGGAGGKCTEANAGGELTVGEYLAPQGLDPVGQPGNAVTGGSEVTALYDTLVAWDPEASTYVPRVAQSFEPNADHSVWTVSLRPDVAFGNGDPLTAEAVIASIERHRSEDNAQVSRGEAATIKAMRAVDDLTVEFTLVEAYPDFPHVLATDVGMITNPAVVEDLGAEDFALNPTGAGVGPYELDRYAPGEEIVLRAKKDYWGGTVCIDQLTFIPISGAQSTFDALDQGEIDVAFLREPQVISQARDAGYQDLPTLINQGEAVIMNSAAGPTQDVTVRKAVVAAIDPDAINQRVWDGTAEATSALVAEGTIGLEPTDEPGYDLDAAKTLVDEAKANGWDGTIRLVADNSPTRVQEAIAVQAQLEAAGMSVTLDNSSALPDLITKVVVDRDYDLAIWGPQFYSEGTWAILNRVLDSSSESYYGYSDPAVDSVLDELKAAATMDEKSAALAELQDLLIENPYAANLCAIEESWAYSDRVHGLVGDRGSIVRFDQAYVSD